MQRNQTANSMQNFFSLNRLKTDCHYAPVKVDFNPINLPKTIHDAIVPIYNNDHLYFTPTFLLPAQKAQMVSNISTEQEKFMDEIRYHEDFVKSECSSLQGEKSRRYKPCESKYCQICRSRFSDYQQHVESGVHKKKLNCNRFTKQIVLLCDEFQTRGKLLRKPIKFKAICKEKQKRKVDYRHQDAMLHSEEILKNYTNNYSTQIVGQNLEII